MTFFFLTVKSLGTYTVATTRVLCIVSKCILPYVMACFFLSGIGHFVISSDKYNGNILCYGKALFVGFLGPFV